MKSRRDMAESLANTDMATMITATLTMAAMTRTATKVANTARMAMTVAERMVRYHLRKHTMFVHFQPYLYVLNISDTDWVPARHV